MENIETFQAAKGKQFDRSSPRKTQTFNQQEEDSRKTKRYFCSKTSEHSACATASLEKEPPSKQLKPLKTTQIFIHFPPRDPFSTKT